MQHSERSDEQEKSLFSSEEYYRVAIHLPVAKPREKLAAKATVAKLQSQFDSYTLSNIDFPSFVGHWKDPQGGNAFRDLISIFSIDTPVIGPDANTDYSSIIADAMWMAAFLEYKRFRANQRSFWVWVSRIAIREKLPSLD